jgi:septum formation protein
MDDDQPKLLVSSSQVTFKSLSDEEIDAYISSNEPMGKAGAYGIQGIGGCLISSISGSYSGIMGLPLFETSQLLNETGVQFSLRP